MRIHETTLENDIRYRGPLTAQHFKLLGWLCIVVSQVAVILRLGGRIDQGFADSTAKWLIALLNIANLALPFLLIASFAQLLNTDEGYKRQLLVNGAAMAGIAALCDLVFYRYIVGSISTFLVDPSEALPAVSGILSLVAPYGFFAFNIFVDLFLCTLTMLFLNYDPRRVFTGKGRIVVRLLALLPIAYEVGCMLLKVRCARGLVQIPIWAWPLLTVKPPMTFVLFLALALFVKTRELRFRRHDKSHEDYQAFLKTRRNSLNFSVFLAIMLVIVSLADLTVALGFSVNEFIDSINTGVETSLREATATSTPHPAASLEALLTQHQASLRDGAAPDDGAAAAAPGVTAAPGSGEATPGAAQAPVWDPQAAMDALSPEELDALVSNVVSSAMEEERFSATMDTGMRLARAVGFGNSVYLILLAPLVLLFSYTRRSKLRMLDMLIPAAGIALILFVYLEGIHQLLPHLPVERVSLKDMKEMSSLYLTLLP